MKRGVKFTSKMEWTNKFYTRLYNLKKIAKLQILNQINKRKLKTNSIS